MRLLALFILAPFFLFSQVQIGNDIDGVAAGDQSGHVSISSDGTIVAIGGPYNDDAGEDAGHVRVFENIHGVWTQIGNAINGDAAGDHFGSSVSLSADGSTLAISGPDRALGGYVRIYENKDDVWVQIGNDIYGEPDYINGYGFLTNLSFGVSVSISNYGTILSIAEDRGSSGYEGGYGNPGFIHIYENISGTWTQVGNYINSGISFLQTIAVSGDGSIVAISGFGDFANCNFYGFVGFVKVYKNISGVWAQLGSTFYGSCWVNGVIGVSLSNNGSKIVIGGTNHVSIYENIDEEWVQLGEDIETEYYFYGNKTSISDDGNILANIGSTMTSIYENNSGNWMQLGIDIINETADNEFGANLELSGDGSKLVVGTTANDSNGIDSGQARVYDLSGLLSVDTPNLSSFKIYPNPTLNEFTIQLGNSQSIKKVNIYSSLGQFIQTSNKQIINTSMLSSGLYFVEVVTTQGKAIKKLIIK